jgi:hypothetical protein
VGAPLPNGHPYSKGLPMENFIARQNVAHYLDQLRIETDPIKRAMLEKLLAEEKDRLATESRASAEK